MDTSFIIQLAAGGFLGTLISQGISIYRDNKNRDFTMKKTLFEKRVQIYSELIRLLRELRVTERSEAKQIEVLSKEIHLYLHKVMFLTSSYDIRLSADHLVFLTTASKLLKKGESLLDDGTEINELEELMQKELGII